MSARLALVFQVSREKKLQLVEKLWDSIAYESQQLLAQWKIDELTRGKKAFSKDSSTVRYWEQVKARILGQHARN